MSWAQVLGARIRAARKQAKLSQAEVAHRLGVWQAAVSQWERGLTEPSSQHFIRLVHLLGPSLLGSPDDPIVTDTEPVQTPSAKQLAGLMRAGLSDGQIADHLGVSPKQIVRWRKAHHLRRPGGRPIQ
jgi:transcriptional regulator with XRE-family HTH domain